MKLKLIITFLFYFIFIINAPFSFGSEENIEPPAKRARVNEPRGKSLKSLYEYQNFLDHKRLENGSDEISTSPLLWNSDDLILSNVLSFLGTPIDLMNLKLILKAKKLPKNAIKLFKGVNEVEILQDDGESITKRMVNLSEDEVPKITKFLYPELTAMYYLEDGSVLSKAWKAEAQLAGLEDREPNYLGLISQLLEVKLRSFEYEKWKNIDEKFPFKHGIKNTRRIQMQNRHRYALLLSMFAAWGTASLAAGSAATSTSWSAAGSAGMDAAMSAFKFADLNAAQFAASLAARSAAGSAAVSAAVSAARSAAGSAAGSAAVSAARSAAVSDARYTVWDAKQIGRVSYRISELNTLLHFLKHFDIWMQPTYESVFKRTLSKIDPHNQNLFRKDDWETFKHERLPHENAYSFLRPWLIILAQRVP